MTVNNELGNVKGNLSRLKLIYIIYYKPGVHKSQGPGCRRDQIANGGN